MLRVLATALAVLALTISMLSFHAPPPAAASQALTPGITLIGKGEVSGSALDTSGLTGNICQAGAPANCVPKSIFGGFGSTGETHEYVYVLDAINRGQGVCEILAINDHEFLVVERDNRSNLQSPPQAPTRKNIYKIDLTGATEVSGIESLPAGALPLGITTVSKQLFINLLDADLNLAATIPEKIEGLTWGPDLARNSALRVRDRSIAIRFPTAISSRPTLSTRAGEEVTALN